MEDLTPIVRLNLGAGATVIEGYTPVDRKFGSEVFPLAVTDGTVDEIRASHVLEHFSHGKVQEVMTNWVSKLKPGGRLRVAVPDFQALSRDYLAGQPLNIQGMVMGGHQDANDHHGCIFDKEALAEMMVQCGLTRLSEWRSELPDCASIPYSLNLQGFKPTPGDGSCKGMVAILSHPRHGPLSHHHIAHRAFPKLGIPYEMHDGAYWHEVITELMEKQLETATYILTCDYDTGFTAEDVRELNRLMDACPWIDALCAVQMRRAGDKALFTMTDKGGKLQRTMSRDDLDRNIVQIYTGHFGLTAIRTASLKKLPRPWMLGRPNKDQRWGEGKIDPDVEFWCKWKDAGLTLFLAPKVVVAHFEECATIPDKLLRPIRIPIIDYMQHNLPAEAL